MPEKSHQHDDDIKVMKNKKDLNKSNEKIPCCCLRCNGARNRSGLPGDELLLLYRCRLRKIRRCDDGRDPERTCLQNFCKWSAGSQSQTLFLGEAIWQKKGKLKFFPGKWCDLFQRHDLPVGKLTDSQLSAVVKSETPGEI